MTEAELFQQVQQLFDYAAGLHHLDPTAFRRDELKEFSTVYYDKYLLFRVRARGEGDFVSFQAGQAGRIPLEGRWTDEMNDALLEAIDDMVGSAGKEYDACALVEACSDAGKCVREDDVRRSLYCGYRKVLRSGRVFYGENRNV